MSVPAYTKRITFLLSGITGTSNMEDRLKNQGLFNLIWQLHGYSCENLFLHSKFVLTPRFADFRKNGRLL